MAKKRKKICIHCESDDIVVDAFARWDSDKDMFVLDEIFEYTFCNVCEGETITKDVELNEELKL